MKTPLLSRRSTWAVAGLAVLAGAALAARTWLAPYAVRSVLRMAGASEIHFTAVRGTPWHLEVDDLDFHVRTQQFSARRIELTRAHWWTSSLGAVRVEGAEMPVYLDGSDTNPWEWARYENPLAPDEAVALPLETLDLEGHLVVRLASAPDMPLTVKLEGRPRTGTSWVGSLVATGPGFHLAGSGSLLRAGQELEFQVHSAELDLAVWSRHAQRLAVLPGAPWDLAGKLTGVAEGRVTARRFASTARISLHGGTLRSGLRDLTATGVEADLEFSDLWKFRTKSGRVRVGEFRVGRLAVADINAEVGMWGARALEVVAVRGHALGGELAVAPFHYYMDQSELLLDVQVDRVAAPQLLALTNGVPVPLSGAVSGRVPLRLQATGVRLERGSLTLDSSPGTELPLNVAAFIRAGAKLDAESLKVLKAAGSDLVPLRLGELRLDIRPEDLPLGASARVRLAGEWQGAPMAASLDLNGAIESYLRVMP